MTTPETQTRPPEYGGATGSVQPLPANDDCLELLHFGDGSVIKINAQMRRDHPHLYSDACRRATSRYTAPNARLDRPEGAKETT